MANRLAIALIMALAWCPARAGAERLKAAHEAAIHLKVLTYDRTLPKRARSTAIIGILYAADVSSSVQAKNEMLEAFQALGEVSKVQGLAISVQPLAYSAARLDEDLAALAAIYVTPGMEGAFDAILLSAIRRNLPILCGDRELARRGYTVAAYRKGNSSGLTVNLATVRAANVDLDSRLFTIAEVLK